MTRMTDAELDHLLQMIERMQRDGHSEEAIHETVRRAARRTHPERRHRPPRDLLRGLRRR